jgi:hypothetical protein
VVVGVVVGAGVLGTGMACGDSRVSCSAVEREGLVARVDGVVEQDAAAAAWVEAVAGSAGAGSVVEIECFIDGAFAKDAGEHGSSSNADESDAVDVMTINRAASWSLGNFK